MSQPRTIDLPDEAATRRLAAALAAHARAGDVILLQGDLGAGKTSFARGFITALGLAKEVPSPTFTLVQGYPRHANSEKWGPGVWHFDLYRLQDPEEIGELGWEDAQDHITLVEWPERLGRHTPPSALTVAFEMTALHSRRASLSAGPIWANRLDKLVRDWENSHA